MTYLKQIWWWTKFSRRSVLKTNIFVKGPFKIKYFVKDGLLRWKIIWHVLFKDENICEGSFKKCSSESLIFKAENVLSPLETKEIILSKLLKHFTYI